MTDNVETLVNLMVENNRSYAWITGRLESMLSSVLNNPMKHPNPIEYYSQRVEEYIREEMYLALKDAY